MEKQPKNDKYICRARIEPSNDGEYDFECVAVPVDNKQLRYSYENDEYFYQVLRTGKENIDAARLESGLPLFDNHPWENTAENTLGISTSFEFTEQGLVTRCIFGARADEALKLDVKNGIIKTVSIEGTISNYTIERQPGMIPIYYADLWEPESLSFAPVPNDIAAQIDVKRAIQKQIELPKADKSISKSLTTKF